VSPNRGSVGWAESASPVTSTAYALFEEFHPDSLPRKNCSVNSCGKTRRIPLRLLGLTGEYRRVFSVSFVLRITSYATNSIRRYQMAILKPVVLVAAISTIFCANQEPESKIAGSADAGQG
jgi:hypothetical protein